MEGENMSWRRQHLPNLQEDCETEEAKDRDGRRQNSVPMNTYDPVVDQTRNILDASVCDCLSLEAIQVKFPDICNAINILKSTVTMFVFFLVASCTKKSSSMIK